MVTFKKEARALITLRNSKKAGINLVLTIILFVISGCSQSGSESEYTGVEYKKLKSELNRGWNTWNTKSVLSHVLLPEAVSVDFYLKDNKSGEVLKEALMGRRGENAEAILPIAHAYDGSYTELVISWKGIDMNVRSCTHDKDIYFLLTPLDKNPGGEVLISPHEIWWNRDGKVITGVNRLIYDLPSGEMNLYAKGKTASGKSFEQSILAYDAGEEIALSTDADFMISDIKDKIVKAKEKHE